MKIKDLVFIASKNEDGTDRDFSGYFENGKLAPNFKDQFDPLNDFKNFDGENQFFVAFFAWGFYMIITLQDGRVFWCYKVRKNLLEEHGEAHGVMHAMDLCMAHYRHRMNKCLGV